MMRLLFVIQLAEVGNEVDPEGAPSPKVNVPEYWARAAGRRARLQSRSEARSEASARNLAVVVKRRLVVIGKMGKWEEGRDEEKDERRGKMKRKEEKRGKEPAPDDAGWPA